MLEYQSPREYRDKLIRVYKSIVQMVSIQGFLINKLELQREIRKRNDIAESELVLQFIAARKLQAWCRGFLTRNHLRMLKKSATIIQRHWRGFMARKFAKSHVKEQVIEMWRQHYHRCATRIQALWRGYRARKSGVDLPKYHKWLESVYEKNTEALTRMQEFRNSELEYMREVMERESMLWVLFILFKLHHLLRTKCQPGILTRIDKSRFTVIENMMRNLEYTAYVEKQRRNKSKEVQSVVDEPPLLLKGTYFARCEREIRDFERSLEMGKASIRRGTPYEEDRKLLKNVENLRQLLLLSKNFSTKPPFRTIVANSKTPCLLNDIAVRVTLGEYDPPNKPAFNSIRPPRDKSKELNGDFKLVVKPNELYEAIDKMDCLFSQLNLKCPIHNSNAGY